MQRPGLMVWYPGQQDPLEKGMATYSHVLAWKIPWTEESGGIQSMGSQGVEHSWETNTSTFSRQHTPPKSIMFRFYNSSKQDKITTVKKKTKTKQNKSPSSGHKHFLEGYFRMIKLWLVLLISIWIIAYIFIYFKVAFFTLCHLTHHLHKGIF